MEQILKYLLGMGADSNSALETATKLYGAGPQAQMQGDPRQSLMHTALTNHLAQQYRLDPVSAQQLAGVIMGGGMTGQEPRPVDDVYAADARNASRMKQFGGEMPGETMQSYVTPEWIAKVAKEREAYQAKQNHAPRGESAHGGRGGAFQHSGFNATKFTDRGSR